MEIPHNMAMCIDGYRRRAAHVGQRIDPTDHLTSMGVVYEGLVGVLVISANLP
jgi:hypothetical protein